MSFSPKDPSSVEHFAFDFGQMLATGDVLTGLTGVTIDVGDGALVIDPSYAPRLIGTAAVVLLQGGTAGTTYQLRAAVTTAGGELLQLSANLLIRRC